MTVTLAGVSLDLTQVLVTLITTIPAILAAIWARTVVNQVRTPSGDTLGAVAERTHDLAAVNTKMITDVHTSVKNGALADVAYRAKHKKDK